MDTYSGINELLSKLELNTKPKSSSNPTNFISDSNMNSLNSKDSEKEKEKMLKEKEQMNSRLFDRHVNIVNNINNFEGYKNSITNLNETKSSKNYDEINKKLSNRNELFNQPKKRPIFEDIPKLTRDINITTNSQFKIPDFK
jgi:hypothetical protein